MLLVPDAALGCKHGAVDGGGPSPLSPGIEQGDQVRAEQGDQRGQCVGHGGQASLPGAARGVTPLGRGQQRAHRRHLWLGQDSEQGMDRCIYDQVSLSLHYARDDAVLGAPASSRIRSSGAHLLVATAVAAWICRLEAGAPRKTPS